MVAVVVGSPRSLLHPLAGRRQRLGCTIDATPCICLHRSCPPFLPVLRPKGRQVQVEQPVLWFSGGSRAVSLGELFSPLTSSG